MSVVLEGQRLLLHTQECSSCKASYDALELGEKKIACYAAEYFYWESRKSQATTKTERREIEASIEAFKKKYSPIDCVKGKTLEICYRIGRHAAEGSSNECCQCAIV